jgi:hypothetical protein
MVRRAIHMKMKTGIAVIVAAVIGLAGCTGDQVVDNTVDTTGYIAKGVVKGVIGTGKIVNRGVKKVTGNEQSKKKDD